MRLQRLSLTVLLVLLAPIAVAQAQTGIPDEFWGTCRRPSMGFTVHEIDFVGTAGEPITYHFSGEAFVEDGRQNMLRAEAAEERLKALFDPQKKYDPTSEADQAFNEALLAARIASVKAYNEFAQRRAMTVRPYDLTLIPIVVEQRLKGDPDPIVMARVTNPAIAIQPGERYLIGGVRSTALLPPFPHMGNAGNVTEYIDVASVNSPDAGARYVQWLSLPKPKHATVVGSLRMQNFGGGMFGRQAELRDARIIFSSGKQVWETGINDAGRFELSGLPPGQLQIRAVLPKDLTITSASTTTVEILVGACKEVHLTANLNGRVRGRIFTTAPFESVKVFLEGGMDPGTLSKMQPGVLYTGASHTARVQTTLKEDGTFELYGVPPGWYVLSAWVEPSKGGTRRSSAYYPGTPEMAYATPIEVGKATVHEGFDFVLPIE